jgi:hypothetical protein
MSSCIRDPTMRCVSENNSTHAWIHEQHMSVMQYMYATIQTTQASGERYPGTWVSRADISTNAGRPSYGTSTSFCELETPSILAPHKRGGTKMGRVGIPKAGETFGLCMQVVRLAALGDRGGCGVCQGVFEVSLHVLSIRSKTVVRNGRFSSKGRRARCVFHLGIKLWGHGSAQRPSERVCLAQDTARDTGLRSMLESSPAWELRTATLFRCRGKNDTCKVHEEMCVR